MAQQVVEAYRWISPSEVIDGLALAETTPGPLIQVTQFVGFLAAHRNPGNLAPLSAAVLGAVLTTWVTFVPSFLWIFAGAPYVERLRDRPRLTGALSTITAAVVGVILNLGVWFGVYTLFGEVEESISFGARLLVPDLGTIDGFGVVVAIGAWIALTRLQQRILTVVGFAAAAGILVTVLG
jgi:chromate transporter